MLTHYYVIMTHQISNPWPKTQTQTGTEHRLHYRHSSQTTGIHTSPPAGHNKTLQIGRDQGIVVVKKNQNKKQKKCKALEVFKSKTKTFQKNCEVTVTFLMFSFKSLIMMMTKHYILKSDLLCPFLQDLI